MAEKLGAIPLSPDILRKSNIGLWAFELDENQEPRMYVDDTMLGLIGLKEQVSPQETYHAWYDNIDPNSYNLVAEAVEKMSAGEHAEVQYPWHHPDGHIMVVRCGGVRNFNYSAGIRIEGCHQDVTEMLHYSQEAITHAVEQEYFASLYGGFLNIIPGLVFVKDARTRQFTFCNDAFVRFSHRTSKDEIIGKDDYDLYDPETAAKFIADDDLALRSDRPHVIYDEEVVDEFDRPLKLQTIKQKFVTPNGDVCMLGVSTDITKEVMDAERLRIELDHAKLRADALKYFTENEGDPIDFLKHFAERMRELLNCDQVIYSDLEETRVMVNSSEIEDTWSVPIEYCQQCRHFDAHNPIYSNGVTEVYDCKKGFRGVPTYKLCPIKSSLTRIVYIDGEVGGYLAIHYVTKHHKFTDVERRTLEEMTRILSLSLSRYVARERTNELENMSHSMEKMLALADEYDPVIVLDPVTGEYNWYYSKSGSAGANTATSIHGEDFYPKVASDAESVIHPEDRARFKAFFTKENIMKIAETGQVMETENRWYSAPEQRYLWKFNKAVRMIDDAGNVMIVIGVIDTTEDKEKEKEFEAQKVQLSENFEVIEALASDYTSVYYIDIESGRVTPYSMNEETEKKMSVIFDEQEAYPDAFKSYVEQFVYEGDREMMLKAGSTENVISQLSRNDKYSVIYRGLDEGEIVFCEMKFVKAIEEKGVLKNVALGFAYKDEEIMAQYFNGKLVSEYLGAFMVDLDTDKYRVYRLPETTSALDRPEKIWSQALADLSKECDPEYAELVRNIGDPEFLKNELADVDRREYFYRFPSASKPWRRCLILVLDRDKGVPSNIIVTFTEIDEYQSKIRDQQEQLQEQQKQLQEALSMAQSANRAKTTFLNNMSHDIRTPMNAIIGYTGLAATHIDNKAQVQDYLSKISQSSDHLLSLINDVLDMSRIESGKMNLDEKPENLSDIIHTLRDIVQADIRAKQLDFFIDSVDISNENVICDKLRLNQVLLNILSNAIKYTPAGGTVSMRISQTGAGGNGYGTFEFHIRDNGIGMSADFIKTIFDPFTRVKSSTVSGIQGTGLGMAITKNIVDMMGGTIKVESEPDKGTEVTVVFDFKLQNKNAAVFDIPELTGMKGLVVDDDSSTCLNVSKMLKNIGMRPDWSTSGKEALIRAKDAYQEDEPFRVYIIDCLMPDMNGIETTRRIRRIVGNDAPIIILSAYDWSDIEDEAREAGVTAFVPKPMFPSDLQSVLGKCLGKEKTEILPEKKKFSFAGRKILLVEDNELNREIASELLEEYGLIVSTANDGDVAVDMMRAARPGDYDLILMDIQVPTMDGYEATRRIRAMDSAATKIPIVAMTANAFEEDRKAALDAGMDEHIAKPIEITKLEQTLSRFL